MKKNIFITAMIITAAMIGISSCNRDYTLRGTTQSPAGTSYLRIVDAAPNFKSILGANDTFAVYVGANKVTGVTPGGTLLMTFGATFPTSSSLYGYVSVPSGTQTIKLTYSGVVNPDSIAITTFSKTFLPDQYYTFMITDSIKSTRDSSQIFVQDSYTTQAITGYYNLRFIHAVWNDTTGKNIDIFSTRNNRNIYTNVKPGTITSFAAYPFNPSLSDTFYVRRSGNAAINLDTLNGVSFSNTRAYTLYYRGDGNTKPTNVPAAPKGRHLATYVNQ